MRPESATAAESGSSTRALTRGSDRTLYRGVKHVVDVVFASTLLALTFPLLLLLMALVKLTSEGPAIYAQVRLGLNGRSFRIYKFRTMFQDCERHTGPKWATTDDPRVTPLGRFLRKSHLDELPQLWNVIRGDMSIVGPRPERPEFVVQLEKVIPAYRDRLLVRPGITGLAQIQLPPDEHIEGVREKVAYDLHYVQTISLGLDLRIVVGTALKIVGLSFPTIRKVLWLSTPASALTSTAPAASSVTVPVESDAIVPTLLTSSVS